MENPENQRSLDMQRMAMVVNSCLECKYTGVCLY